MNPTLASEPKLARRRGGGTRKPSPLALRRRSIVLALPALLILAVHEALISRPFIDDSYIFYRYAANWAHGLGPVFNHGEHVEGFSSFLWTAILAAGSWLGFPPQEAAPVIGITLAALCLVAVVGIGRRLIPAQPWLRALAAIALALSPPFVMYSSSGMDATLFSLVLLGAAAASAAYVEAVRRAAPVRGPLLVALTSLLALVLVRAEGPVYALVLAFAAGGFCLTGKPARRQRWRAALAPSVAVVAMSALVLLARQLTFGAWVPATAMAKDYAGHLAAAALGDPARAGALWVALGWGVSYIGPAGFAVVGVVSFSLAVDRRRNGRFQPLAALGCLAILLALAIAIWSSGDWMPFRRLLVSVLPLMALLMAWSAGVLSGSPARFPRALHRGVSALAAAAGCALAILACGVFSGPTAAAGEAAQLRALGQILASAPSPVRLLTNLAGVLPYSAGVRTYVWDMLGLTDLHNARYGQIFSPQFGRTDPSYDFSRRFDLFVSNSSWDLALILDSLRQTNGGWVLLSDPEWRRIPLYVVVRENSALVQRLRPLCGCRATELSPSTARGLLLGLRAKGALPADLLPAARSGRAFPA